MSLCWSCEREATGRLPCGHCGALTAPGAGETFFEVLGLPVRYAVDLTAAEAAFKERSRQVHPDRFARADPRARQISLRRTVQLNEAWRTIKHPVRRAEYLMRLFGYDLAGEGGATGPAAGGVGSGAAAGADVAGASRARIVVSPALLGDILELREALLEARAAGDADAVARLGNDVGQRLAGALEGIARGLADIDIDMDIPLVSVIAALPIDSSPEKKEKLDAVAEQLIAIRYYQRFLDELDASAPGEARAPARAGGAPAGSGSA